LNWGILPPGLLKEIRSLGLAICAVGFELRALMITGLDAPACFDIVKTTKKTASNTMTNENAFFMIQPLLLIYFFCQKNFSKESVEKRKPPHSFLVPQNVIFFVKKIFGLQEVFFASQRTMFENFFSAGAMLRIN
jgi:hypothetical protein